MSGIFLIIICCICYACKRDFFHPAVIVSAIWTVMLNLFLYTANELYPLSAKTQGIIVGWVVCFALFACLCSNFKIKVSECFKRYYPDRKFLVALYPYVCILNVLFVFLVLKVVGHSFSLEALVETREGLLEEEFPIYLKLLFYFNSFSVVYLLVASLFPDILTKRQYLFLLCILLASTIVKTNKTAVIGLACGFFYIYKLRGKLNFYSVVKSVMLVVGILFLSISLRGDVTDSFDLLGYLNIYTLSPLAAMDMVVNQEYAIDTGAWGSSTFVFFYKILNAFGCDFDIASRGEWVNVPVPTNVFTVLRGFYLDFGMTGTLIFASLLGGFWGVMYRFASRGFSIFIIFYALMLHSLILQFFADYFFITFSMTLQCFVFSILFFVPIRLRGKSSEL